MTGPLVLLLVLACAACATAFVVLLEGAADDWQARRADTRARRRWEATQRALRAGTKRSLP